jgi:hypothetical protein
MEDRRMWIGEQRSLRRGRVDGRSHAQFGAGNRRRGRCRDAPGTQHGTVGETTVQDAQSGVESYTASAGALGPGDTVVVYASPRESTSIGAATTLVDQARVVAVGRADQASAVASGGSTTRPLWVTLDLDPDQAARVEGASHSAYVDLALLAPGDTGAAR